MASGFPCPNPVCKHLFTLEDLKGLTFLKCPKCQKAFRMGSGPTPSSRKETQITIPEKFQEESKPSMSERRQGKKKKSSLGLWIFVGFSILLAGTTLYLFLKIGLPAINNQNTKKQTDRQETLSVEANHFKLDQPKGMKQDTTLAKKTKTQIAFSSTQKISILVLAKDFMTREPTEGELKLEVFSRLQDLFKNKLEWEVSEQSTKLGSISAVNYNFIGEMEDNTNWEGVCLASTYKGILFLIFQYHGIDQAKTAEPIWQTFVSRFQIRTETRANWSPIPRKTKTFNCKNTKYNLQIPIDVWIEQKSSDYPLKPLAVFLGKNPKDIGNFGNQLAKIYLFDVSKASAESKDWNDLNSAILKVLNESPESNTKLVREKDPEKPNNQSPEITTEMFQLKDGDMPVNRIEIFKKESDTGSSILILESPWKNREFWHDELIEILKSAKTP